MKQFIILLVFSTCLIVKAQTTTIPIPTKDHALVLQTTKDDRLKMVYFGAALSNTKDYSDEPKPEWG